MATPLKNLSSYDPSGIPEASGMKFGIVVSEWNRQITEALYHGAYNTLTIHGARDENIFRIEVPGSYELIAGAQMLAKKYNPDAVICLGCIIKGETRHDEYLAAAISKGLIDLTLKFEIPFIFGVLTTENTDQAKDRSGGKHGNKGDEAAVTAIRMAAL